MSGRAWSTLGALVAVLSAAQLRCYAPEIGDGTLGCAAGGICPRGFSCGGDGHCWHAPDAGRNDAASSGGAAGEAGVSGAAGTGSGGAAGKTGAAGGGAAGATHPGGAGGGSPPDAGGGPLGLGTPCSGPGACGSGFCVDGVCCDAACAGTCEACDVEASPGRCAPVTSGPPHGTRARCGGQGACAGACGPGSRTACAFPGMTSVCRAQTCSEAILSPTAFCDGSGTCGAPATSTCPGGLACNGAGTSCLTACQRDADCVSPLPYCQGSACTAARPAGTACDGDGQCQSGHCTDGVCCDLACTGQCQACDVSGHAGTCWPIPSGDAPHGQRGACAGSGICAGACDGSASQCVFPGSGTACPCALLTGSCNSAGACAMVGNLCL